MSSAKAEVSNNHRLLDQWSELESAHSRVREALERALEREHRLSLSEYEVLRRLADDPKGHRRIQELADEIHLSQSALSRLVGRLEDAGFVSRAICDHDRRGIFACITDAGRKAQEEAHPTHLAVLSETLAEHGAAPASEHRDAYVLTRDEKRR
jgi:DNA-binding MarR family transcriptional regulator